MIAKCQIPGLMSSEITFLLDHCIYLMATESILFFYIIVVEKNHGFTVPCAQSYSRLKLL